VAGPERGLRVPVPPLDQHVVDEPAEEPDHRGIGEPTLLERALDHAGEGEGQGMFLLGHPRGHPAGLEGLAVLPLGVALRGADHPTPGRPQPFQGPHRQDYRPLTRALQPA